MSLLLAVSTAQAHDSLVPHTHGHDPVSYVILVAWLLGAAGLFLALQRSGRLTTR